VLLLIGCAGAASPEVEGEHAEGKGTHAEGHVEPVAGAVRMMRWAGVGIMAGRRVEVDVGKGPTAEKVFEAAAAFVGRFRSLALRPRRNFVPRVRLIGGPTPVQRHQFVTGQRRFTYGASLAIRPRLQPLMNAWPTVEMTAHADHGLVGHVKADVAFEIRATGG